MTDKRSDEEWLNHAEGKLWELVDGVEVTREQVDKDGTIHTLRSKLPPNVDAIKFALKNRSKGKWADKTEVTNTQINVNLTASYNEVKQIMAQQKAQLSAPSEQLIPQDIIEGEIISDSSTNSETI